MFMPCPPGFRRHSLVFLSHELEAHAMRRLLAHHHLAVRQAAESLRVTTEPWTKIEKTNML